MKSFSPRKSMDTNTTQPSRREFLTKTALFTGGILAFGWPTGRSNSVFAVQSRQTLQRGGTVRYLLELDGAIVGPLNTMENGFVSGDIIMYQDGNDLIMRKRLGRLKYEDIVLTCGANLSLPFYQWLAGTLDGDGLNPRKNGAIVAVNPNGQIIDRREFQNTLVKEVQFPALDGLSNEPAYFTVTLTPERIQYQSASGQAGPPPQANHVSLNTSRFRLQIQGLEQACAFVRRIEPLVVKQEIINYQDGRDARQSRVSGGRLEVGNLVITLPQHQAGPFTEWFSSFVLQGQISGNTKQGLLEFLAPDAQTVLAAVTLHNLGIFRMGPVTREGAYQVQVEMYCERVQLTQFPGSGANSTQRQAPRLRRKIPRKPATGKQLPRIQEKK